MSDLIKLSGSQNKKNKQQQLKDMKAEWEAAKEKENQWEEKGTKEDHRG